MIHELPVIKSVNDILLLSFFFHILSPKKEERIEPCGECGQKYVIKSDYNDDGIDYLHAQR